MSGAALDPGATPGADAAATTDAIAGVLADGSGSNPSRTRLAASLRWQATSASADIAGTTRRQRARHAMARGDYCMTQAELDPLTKQQSPEGQSDELVHGMGGCTKSAFRP
jgi:hypothetical protein